MTGALLVTDPAAKQAPEGGGHQEAGHQSTGCKVAEAQQLEVQREEDQRLEWDGPSNALHARHW